MSSRELKEDHLEIAVEEFNYLELYHKKKWRKYLFYISGSALYYKSKEKDVTLKGVIKLKGGKLVPCIHQKNFSWGIEIGSESYYLAAANESEYEKWRNLITKGFTMEIGDIGKVKQKKLMSIKKNVAGTVATSSIGKSAIKEAMGSDGYKLISQVIGVIELRDGKKKAKEIKEGVIKIVTKVILLYQNKDISYNELASNAQLSREIWSNMLDYLEMPFALEISKLQNGYETMKKSYSSIFKPYMTEKNVNLFIQIMEYFSSDAFLNYFYNEQSGEMDKLRNEIANSLRVLWVKAFGDANK